MQSLQLTLTNHIMMIPAEYIRLEFLKKTSRCKRECVAIVVSTLSDDLTIFSSPSKSIAGSSLWGETQTVTDYLGCLGRHHHHHELILSKIIMLSLNYEIQK